MCIYNRLKENRKLYIFAVTCALVMVLCHQLRIAIFLLLVDSLVLSVVCVLDLPFAWLCQILFMLTVLSTVARVTEHFVKGFCSSALHHHINP
jgi:hypothetical protein